MVHASRTGPVDGTTLNLYSDSYMQGAGQRVSRFKDSSRASRRSYLNLVSCALESEKNNPGWGKTASIFPAKGDIMNR
jgi:hypothetical protein